MNGQELAVGFEPAENSLDIRVPLRRIDGAKEGVFEHPVECAWWFVGQKIGQSKFSSGNRTALLLCQANGRWRKVKTARAKAGLRPGAHIVPRPAARHANRA